MENRLSIKYELNHLCAWIFKFIIFNVLCFFEFENNYVDIMLFFQLYINILTHFLPKLLFRNTNFNKLYLKYYTLQFKVLCTSGELRISAKNLKIQTVVSKFNVESAKVGKNKCGCLDISEYFPNYLGNIIFFFFLIYQSSFSLECFGRLRRICYNLLKHRNS